MINNFKQLIIEIDNNMVRKWVEELVFTNTFKGINFQKLILKTIAEEKNMPYKLANTQERAKNIAGYIGSKPFSIKSLSYKSKPMLPEDIKVDIIYYEEENGYEFPSGGDLWPDLQSPGG